MRKALIIPAALLAGLTLSAASFAGGGHRGHGDHCHMKELKALDLSEAQRDTIKAHFEAAHEEHRAERKAARALHDSVEAAVPGSPEFQAAVARLADAQANEARARVHRHAELRTKVYGVLTAEQKAKHAQLAAERAARHGDEHD